MAHICTFSSTKCIDLSKYHRHCTFDQVLYNGYFHCAEPILDKFIAALEKEMEGNMNNCKMEIQDEMIWEEYSECHGGGELEWGEQDEK